MAALLSVGALAGALVITRRSGGRLAWLLAASAASLAVLTVVTGLIAQHLYDRQVKSLTGGRSPLPPRGADPVPRRRQPAFAPG